MFIAIESFQYGKNAIPEKGANVQINFYCKSYAHTNRWAGIEFGI